MNISSFNQVLVDPSALEHNFRLISKQAGQGVRVMAMVKSDAYGHGLVQAAEAFGRAGCTLFGVVEIHEAVALREAGCSGDIFILLGFDPAHVDYLFSHRLTPVIFNEDDLQILSRAAVARQQTISTYLKFDCGMGRLGFNPGQAVLLKEKIGNMPHLELAGIMSHYPCSDEKASGNSIEVNRLFTEVFESFQDYPGLVRSICNSGGALYFPENHYEMVRAGIALYGYYPDGAEGRSGTVAELLKPAMRFSTRVIQVKDIVAGSGISYGHTYVADHDLKLAVLPVGYSNGYPRVFSNRSEVLIRGRRAPVRGRICMNLCMVEVSGIDGVQPGDEAILLGVQGDDVIDADQLAAWSESISYEILCSIGNNNERMVARQL